MQALDTILSPIDAFLGGYEESGTPVAVLGHRFSLLAYASGLRALESSAREGSSGQADAAALRLAKIEDLLEMPGASIPFTVEAASSHDWLALACRYTELEGACHVLDALSLACSLYRPDATIEPITESLAATALSARHLADSVFHADHGDIHIAAFVGEFAAFTTQYGLSVNTFVREPDDPVLRVQAEALDRFSREFFSQLEARYFSTATDASISPPRPRRLRAFEREAARLLDLPLVGRDWDLRDAA